MILIADSGSTKTNWALVEKGEDKLRLQTEGINPFYRNIEDISDELEKELLPKISGNISAIKFYGAGIINSAKGAGLKKLLQDMFPMAEVEANSDLLAAARSTLGQKPGIACILGTGSNSCYYDGIKIAEHVSPLGFILGDEGSGAVMGRKLLGDYLKKVMPENLREKFQYELTGSVILENVYRKQRPNLFLASFTRFIHQNLEAEYFQKFLKTEFEAFADRNLVNYKKIHSCQVTFVGSVAFFFQEILKEVLADRKIKCGEIVKDPMDGLIQYHSSH